MRAREAVRETVCGAVARAGGPPPGVLARLHAAAGNGAVARLLAVQRTTGTEVQSWVQNEFTPAHNGLVGALAPLVAKGGSNLGDVGLDKKLAAVTQQLHGHTREVAYGAGKIVQHGKGVAFGTYTLDGNTYGADVTTGRKAGAATPEKAVQLKVVSTPSPDNVSAALVDASTQLAGQTKSGELPHSSDQRVITVVIRHADNPYPWGAGHSADFTPVTRGDIGVAFHDRLHKISLYDSFDKVKLVYDPPRATKSGAVRSVTIVRPGGGRGVKDLRTLASAQYGGK